MSTLKPVVFLLQYIVPALLALSRYRYPLLLLNNYENLIFHIAFLISIFSLSPNEIFLAFFF